MGEGSSLYDPGSGLYYWEGESSASITMNGMGKRKEVKSITAAVITRYPASCTDRLDLDRLLYIMQLVNVQLL